MTPTLSTFKPGDTVRIVVSDWGIPVGTLIPVASVFATPNGTGPSPYIWVEYADSTWPFTAHEVELVAREAPSPEDRLRDAAPALLDALQDLLSLYLSVAWISDCGSWNPEKDAPVKAARAAIAQATGSGAAS
jgi:hypothetical protein